MSAATLRWTDALADKPVRRGGSTRQVDFQDSVLLSMQVSHAAKEKAFLGAMLSKRKVDQTTTAGLVLSYDKANFTALGVVGDWGRVAVDRNTAISSRLAELDNILYEDAGSGLSQEAKAAFITFMRANPRVSVPSLTADSGGELVAVWRRGGESMSLRFFEGTKFHYALAIRKDEKVVRPWGTTTAAELIVRHPEYARIAA